MQMLWDWSRAKETQSKVTNQGQPPGGAAHQGEEGTFTAGAGRACWRGKRLLDGLEVRPEHPEPHLPPPERTPAQQPLALCPLCGGCLSRLQEVRGAAPHHPHHARGQRHPRLRRLQPLPQLQALTLHHPGVSPRLPAFAGHKSPAITRREFNYFSLLNTNTSRHMCRIFLRGLRITTRFYPHKNPVRY